MIEDIINPMELDFSKKLHGHVRVETRSRWTGRVVDSQEKENLVTNAVAQIYKSSRISNTQLWNWFAPLYSKALGGLLLFDGALTESASNVNFPGSAKLVGFAGQAADTTHPMAGSMNEAECLFTSNGYTTVWDFLTSQANGTIGAVARTSDQFANRGIAGGSSIFSNSNLGPYTWGSTITPLGYDATNKYLYLALASEQTYNGVTYSTNKIYRTYCDFEAQPLVAPYLINNPDRWTAIITVSSGTDGTDYGYDYVYDPFSDNFYYGATGSAKKIYLISTSGTRNSISVPENISYKYSVVATENYYWYRSSSSIYQVKKSNPSDTSSVTPSFTPTRMVALKDDCIMIGGANNSSDRALIYSDLSIVYVVLSTGIIQNMDILSSQYSSSIGRAPMLLSVYMGLAHATSSNNSGTPFQVTSYLGTIANLDSPVTKTSSQTMKITYTLTEA